MGRVEERRKGIKELMSSKVTRVGPLLREDFPLNVIAK